MRKASLSIAQKGCVKPFVKWAGGKSQLLEQLDALLPRDFSTRKGLAYVETFVGGGAMLFHVLDTYPNVDRVIINDLNKDLVTCYNVIKSKSEELIAILEAFQDDYRSKKDEEERKELFYDKRERYNTHKGDDVEVAALFIFLNKTAFNGLYRVNAKGGFNVPFNRAKNPLICDANTIRADSIALRNVEILCGDYERVLDVVGNGQAFFYFDPPYRPLSPTASFTSYSKDGFDDEQQKRLSEFCRKLDSQGYQWLLSNSDPHNANPNDMFFDDLYKGFYIQRVFASRMINSDANGRGRITELAIRNYKE